MTRLTLFSTAAILSLMSATPVFAQAAIQEPGAFAFSYPNLDVLNGGRPTPAAGMDTRTLLLFNSRAAHAIAGTRGSEPARKLSGRRSY